MPGPGFSFIDGEEERHLLEVFRSQNLTRYRFDSGSEALPTKTYQFEREPVAIECARYGIIVQLVQTQDNLPEDAVR